jgi:hypothetical protein
MYTQVNGLYRLSMYIHDRVESVREDWANGHRPVCGSGCRDDGVGAVTTGCSLRTRRGHRWRSGGGLGAGRARAAGMGRRPGALGRRCERWARRQSDHKKKEVCLCMCALARWH